MIVSSKRSCQRSQRTSLKRSWKANCDSAAQPICQNCEFVGNQCKQDLLLIFVSEFGGMSGKARADFYFPNLTLWNRLLHTAFGLAQVPLKLNWSLKWNFLFVCLWSYRAFDTLAKALNPGESAACQNSESIDSSAQVLGGETSMNIVEIEGPLLSDAHVAFRVLNYFLTVDCL